MLKPLENSPVNSVIQGKNETSLQNLNFAQYQHLLNVLQTQLAGSKANNASSIESEASSSLHIARTFLTIHSSFKSPNCWIVDSGASTHICFSRSSFVTFISYYYIGAFPNNCQVQVTAMDRFCWKILFYYRKF